MLALQVSYAVWKSMEIDLNIIPGLEKYGKKTAEYGKIFAFSDYCPYLVFYNRKLRI